ncbi:MAG TPA: extracellular solute-binding protein [Pseudonocardiaceae bacterium]|jgi:raffinose/stachyose/melibiose transport system substrate-binding protein|nr:extracellular solute-binding protein [Pseudonocardiaceae bacterium]
MRQLRSSRVLVIAAAVAIAATACGGGGSASGPTDNSITWWHNATTDPLKSVWQQAADAYHTAHPDVSFQVDPIQNEQFNTKVPLALQSNDPPDLYQQWGGGQEASQISSGKVEDLTSATSSWISQLGQAAAGWQVDGKQYGVPYDLHAVGFWYRKDLFTQAGITSTPTTMDELNADVGKLKAARIAPIAIGSKDRWPDAFYWDYFAVRECSIDVLKASVKSLKLTDPCWTKAGTDVKTFLATNPFQTGFLGTPAQQGAGSSAGMVANGQAAMELQGDWEPGTMSALTSDKDLTSKMGWFPFPAIAGGQGNPAVVLGGGDGFSCTTKAPTACADFLKYLDSAPVQDKFVATGSGLPANPAAASALTDPNLKTVLDYYQKAPYIQNYFDIAFPTAAGQALDDAVANYFAGQGSPQTIISAVTSAASGDR